MWYRNVVHVCVGILIEGNGRVVFGRQAAWIRRRLKRIRIRSVMYVPLFSSVFHFAPLSLSLAYSLWILLFFCSECVCTIEYSRGDSKENIWCSLFLLLFFSIGSRTSMCMWPMLYVQLTYNEKKTNKRCVVVFVQFSFFVCVYACWRTCNFDISF